MPSRLLRHLRWGLPFLLAAELILFWGALVRGETFAERDLQSFHRPTKALVAPLWEESRGIPLWNPLFSSGQPFAANPQHEIFHPTTALFLVLPFEVAFRLQVLLPPLAGGWAAYALARALRRSREAALLGAVSWGFGGYLLSATNLLPTLLSASVLPAVLAFAIRSSRRPGAADLAGLAIATALLGLAGEPSVLLMSVPLVLAALASGPARGRSGPLRLARPALGLALGLGLASATLLPGLHHATKTVRRAGLGPSEAGEWSFPPVRVAELVSPHVMGHVEKGDEAWYWGRDLYGSKRYPFLYSIYPGLPVTLLALLGAARGARRLWPWLATAALGLLLAVGVHGPVWESLRRLPVLSGLRYPERFVLLLALPLVVAAVHGFDWTLVRGGRRRAAAAAAFGIALAAGVAAAGGISWAEGLSPRPWTALGIAPHLEGSFAGTASRDALRVALVAAGGLVAVLAARRRRRIGALALVAVTCADLAQAGRAVVPSVPLAQAAEPPAALAPLVARPPAGPLFHLAADDPVRGQARLIAKPPAPAQWGIAMTLERDFDMTFLRSTELGRKLFWEAVARQPALLPRLLERRGVGAILKFRTGARVVDGAVRPPPGSKDPLELAVVARPRPLVFPADRVTFVEAPGAWVEAVVRSGDAIPGTVVLEAGSARGLPERPSPAEVVAIETRPGWVGLEVEARGPESSVLALNQTWDEGWQLRVDGRPGQLLVADVSLSAFALPPGRHRVEIRYGDPWVTAGLAVSGVSALALAAALLADRARRSRRLLGGAVSFRAGAFSV